MSNYIKNTVARINRAAENDLSGPVAWCDDALATAVGILLNKVEEQQVQIDELIKRVDALESAKRVVAVQHVDGRTEYAHEFADELEEQIAALADYDATVNDASYRRGF